MARVVVVTGASSGVGRATARHFASRGWDVGLVARNAAALENARREVESLGRRARVALADVADAGAVERAADEVERELGPIDVWVNNAMASVFAAVQDIRPDEIRRVTEVTYLGTVYGTMSALRRMRRRGRGVIIQVGSALGYRAIPLQSAYCGAKHALLGFTEALRCELLHDKSPVRLVTVNLPAINTPQFDQVRSRLPGRPRPVAPVYQPEVAARAIYAAVRLRRRELNVGYMCSTAILGGHLAPGLTDRYLAATGYEAQLEPGPPPVGDNLFRPPAGDPGAHGSFDAEAWPRSAHLWFELHRGAVLAALAVVAAAAAWGRRHV